MTSSYNDDEELGRLKEEENKKLNEEYQEVTNPKPPKLLGSQLIDNLYGRVEQVGQSIVKASEDDPDTWTDDAVRLGLGGAKNVGNVLSAPGIKQALQVLGAPAWVVGQGLGWTLEKAGVDPRYGHIAGEVGEWFIPFYGASKLLKKTAQGTKLLTKAKHLNKYDDAVDAFKTGQRYMEQEFDLPTNILQRVLQTPDEASYLRTQIVNAIDGGDPPGFIRWQNPEWVQTVKDKMFQWGMKDGVYNHDKFLSQVRKQADGTPAPKSRQSSRALIEFFETPKQLAANFSGFRKAGRSGMESKWLEFLEARGISPNAIQVHHIDALYDSIPLYDGLKFDSPEWWDLTATLLKENVRPGTTFFNDKGNLKYVLGFRKQYDTPHGVAHLFYKDELVDFFSPSELMKIRTVEGYREFKALDFAQIVNKSEDIVEQAMKVWTSLNPKGGMTLDDTIEFLGTLDDQGRLPTKIIDGKYQVPQMTDLIKHITELMDDLPPTVRKDPETFELWLLNTLIDTGVSKNLLLPIKKKFNPNVIKGSGKPRYIKKKYPKPD